MRRAGVSSGPLDTYIRSLHDGERFYASWVRSYLEDPMKPGDWNGPGTPRPTYPARWSEEHARGIAANVLRLYGEEEGWRTERRFEGQRALNRIVADAARTDASHQRLEAALRYGRPRRRKASRARSWRTRR